MATHDGKGGVTERHAPAADGPVSPSSSEPKPVHGAPEVVVINDDASAPEGAVTTIDELEASTRGRFAYFKTREFYIVLVLGYAIDPRSTPAPKY